jgi:HK97 family phage prohead protease
MKKNKRALRMEIKQLTDAGSFEGVLATYGNVDLGGDVIEPGAFTKSIKEHGPEVKLLWQHEPSNVIGTLQLIDGPDALRVNGQIELDDDIPFSRTAYKLLKKRLLSGLSIGYDTVKDSVENGVRHLKELRLWEGSLVTFPMNEQAGVTNVKRRGGPSGRKDDFNEEYTENVVMAAPWQMLDAISESLFDLLWSGDLTPDEVTEAARLALQQFTDAWLAWLPQYMELIAADAGEMGYMRRSAMQVKAKLIASERKEGRRFSGATASALKDCHSNIKSADSILRALFDDEADDDEEEDAAATSEEKAAREKPEPISDHSAAESLIESIRALIPAANGSGKQATF